MHLVRCNLLLYAAFIMIIMSKFLCVVIVVGVLFVNAHIVTRSSYILLLTLNRSAGNSFPIRIHSTLLVIAVMWTSSEFTDTLETSNYEIFLNKLKEVLIGKLLLGV